MKTLLSLFILFSYILTQNYIQGESCIKLKGLYSPINIINVNLDQLFTALDPQNIETSVEILDILFDNKTNRFKYVFKIGRRNQQPMYMGILSSLETGTDNKQFQKVLKTVQSEDFSDIQSPQTSQLKCPQLKKHFYQELRDQVGLTMINRYKDYRQDTNEPIADPRIQVDINSLNTNNQKLIKTIGANCRISLLEF